MPAILVNRVIPTLKANDHPYMNGRVDAELRRVRRHRPGGDRRDPDATSTASTCATRRTRSTSRSGRYHPFDGDGMLHAMSFQDGQASYRNRFVRTKRLPGRAGGRQRAVGRARRQPGRSRSGPAGARTAALKDTSSTDVVVHAGKVAVDLLPVRRGLSAGPGHAGALAASRAGSRRTAISAHPKVDEATGELLFFNYSKYAPYMHYGVVEPDNRLKHYVPIPLPGPRLPHDMAFTKNYSILQRPAAVLGPGAADARASTPCGSTRTCPRASPSCRATGSRRTSAGSRPGPAYVLHWLNAYEDGDEVVLDGYFQEDPTAAGRWRAAPARLRPHDGVPGRAPMKPKLHRWRFNLKTGGP